MSNSVCRSCRRLLQSRFRKQLSNLKNLRREYHRNPPLRSQLQSWYWETTEPTQRQLDAASQFFRTHPPTKLWTATEWRRQGNGNDDTLIPEVAFLGRSNVGKSSLLNALLYTPDLNRVGSRPGKTTSMHAWGLSAKDPNTGGAVRGMKGEIDTKLTILDAPGYGYASRDDWGQEIIKYLSRRKQLRRIFLLFDPLHGIKSSDQKMLELLRTNNIPHQIIASKCDRLLPSSKRQELLQDAMLKMKDAVQPFLSDRNNDFVGLGEIIAVGSLGDGGKNTTISPASMEGIANVQWSVLRATGLEEFAERNHGLLSVRNPSETRTDPSSFTPLKGELRQSSDHRSILEDLFSKTSVNMSSEPASKDQTPVDSTRNVESKPQWKGANELLAQLGLALSRPREESIMRDHESFESISKLKARRMTPAAAQRSNTDISQNKKVGRGLEDLMAMTGANDPPSKKPRQSSRSQPRLNTKARRRQPVEIQTKQPPKPPLPIGPGVSRGMDALLAFTGADESKPGKTARRTARRKALRDTW